MEQRSIRFMGFSHIHQLYIKNDAHYTGRATVAILWDKEEHCIVNNESADVAYHGLFKCNIQRIVDYPYLQSYLERLYAIPAFNETTTTFATSKWILLDQSTKPQ